MIDILPRCGAVAICIAGLAILLRPVESPVVVNAPLGPLEVEHVARPVSWDIRTGGWSIKLDGVVVSFPSADELIASDPAVPYRLTLSHFDELIARHAEAEGFDWRLIAALIFEESRFNPNSVSSRGALGLMQVREIAARDVGEDSFLFPEDNVRTGVRYLSSLRRDLGGGNDRDTLQLALAAYNAGPAHLRDAQAVATRLGLKPFRWHGGVREALPMLERPSIYSRLANGFAKGSAVVAYVDRIWERFLGYQRATAAFEVSLARAR